jgi:hypothetical protein
MKHERINKLLGGSMPHRHELEGGHTPQGDLRLKRMN